MSVLSSSPTIKTHLETQAVLYPTLRCLVRLLPLDHRRVTNHLHREAKHNPFLVYRNPSGSRETLLEDVLPAWYCPPAAAPNLQDHLQGQISALSLSSRQRDALIYLTQWLSPSGYLEESLLVWAAGSIWSAKELDAVVPYLQKLDPPGIGARSLQECLLLQLQDQPQSLTTLLIKEYLNSVAACIGNSDQAKQNRETLLETLKQTKPHINLETLGTAIRQIQALEPRPARNFSYYPVTSAIPDLKATHDTGIWQVSLAYEVEQDFCLNEEAIALLQNANRKSRETQRLETFLQKARSLLTALNQWQDNILKVGEFLVARQQAFLESRDAIDLVPTPQQIVAQSVGLSDATISRIVRERYLLIEGQPSQIMPLRSLCPPARVGGRTPQQIQQLLIQLVQAESPSESYSDEQLADLMKLRFGLAIARRTVTKYRKLAGISTSHQRKLTESRGRSGLK